MSELEGAGQHSLTAGHKLSVQYIGGGGGGGVECRARGLTVRLPGPARVAEIPADLGAATWHGIEGSRGKRER